jgi:beta-phosphoglucomutase-like phosphatase (HAD superfamily)
MLVSALLLSACGGMSKKEYEKEVNKIGAQVSKDLEGIQGGQPSEAEIKKAKTALNTAADDLDDLDPPKDAEKGHEALVKGVRGLSELVEKLGKAMALAEKNPTEAMKMLSGIQNDQSFKDLATASKELKKAGIDIGELPTQ